MAEGATNKGGRADLLHAGARYADSVCSDHEPDAQSGDRAVMEQLATCVCSSRRRAAKAEIYTWIEHY